MGKRKLRRQLRALRLQLRDLQNDYGVAYALLGTEVEMLAARVTAQEAHSQKCDACAEELGAVLAKIEGQLDAVEVECTLLRAAQITQTQPTDSRGDPLANELRAWDLVANESLEEQDPPTQREAVPHCIPYTVLCEPGPGGDALLDAAI